MPRRSRESLNTSFFHVIVQGVNKEFIFSKETYKEKYLKLLKAAKSKFVIDIIAYTIMSNHVHLLIHADNINELSGFMKKVNEDFARYYNYKENRVGYVFRDRFLSEPITNRKYLLYCISYIHNNPVKANLVKECKDYKYSSYNDYINKTRFINSRIIKMVFENKVLDMNAYQKLHSGKMYYFAEYENMLKENMNEIIRELEIRYQKKWSEIIRYTSNLQRVIPEIKERVRISNYELARYVKIHRHRVDNILKNYNKEKTENR